MLLPTAGVRNAAISATATAEAVAPFENAPLQGICKDKRKSTTNCLHVSLKILQQQQALHNQQPVASASLQVRF